jgi:hypothetical protein
MNDQPTQLLPEEFIIRPGRAIKDMEAGEEAWVGAVQVDEHRTVYIQLSAPVFPERKPALKGRATIKVRRDANAQHRLKTSWTVWIPRSRLPLEPKERDMLSRVCVDVDHIHIVEDGPHD